VNKLYNAGKLVLGKLQDFDSNAELPKESQEAFDKWILQRSIETAEEMAKAFENYEFLQARRLFEDFFWSEFCDNYLEIAKGRLSIDSGDKERAAERISAQHAAYQTFLNILKMASPFVSHITEEMYHAEVAKKGDAEGARESIDSKSDKGYFYRSEGGKSIHNAKWPSATTKPAGAEIMDGAKLALFVISEGRKVKTVKKIRFGASVSLMEIKCPKAQHGLLKPFLEDIAFAMRAEKIAVADSEKTKVSVEGKSM